MTTETPSFDEVPERLRGTARELAEALVADFPDRDPAEVRREAIEVVLRRDSEERALLSAREKRWRRTLVAGTFLVGGGAILVGELLAAQTSRHRLDDAAFTYQTRVDVVPAMVARQAELAPRLVSLGADEALLASLAVPPELRWDEQLEHALVLHTQLQSEHARVVPVEDAPMMVWLELEKDLHMGESRLTTLERDLLSAERRYQRALRNWWGAPWLVSLGLAPPLPRPD